MNGEIKMRVYCIKKSDYLAHSGVKGMKWGQRKDGRARGATNSKRAATLKKKVAKGRTAVLEALGLKKKTPPPSASDLNKKDIIRRGDVKQAYAKRHEFTDKELQSVINRYNKEQELRKLTVDAGNQKIKNLSSKIDTTTDVVVKSSKLWNAGARVVNYISEADLPIISIGSGDDRNRRNEVREAKEKRKAESEANNKKAESEAKDEDKKS